MERKRKALKRAVEMELKTIWKSTHSASTVMCDLCEKQKENTRRFFASDYSDTCMYFCDDCNPDMLGPQELLNTLTPLGKILYGK
jgi:hypothetical protein